MYLQAEFEIEKVKHNISLQLNNIQTLAPSSSVSTAEKPVKTSIPNNIKRRLMR